MLLGSVVTTGEELQAIFEVTLTGRSTSDAAAYTGTCPRLGRGSLTSCPGRAGKVRTLNSPATIFYANLPHKNHSFLMGVQHLFLDVLDLVPVEGSSYPTLWEYFVKTWLITGRGINNNPRFGLYF